MIKNETVAEPETFEIELPDEPPVGSVVIDRFGRAWQRLAGARFGHQWCVAGPLPPVVTPLADAPQLSWGHLLLQRGEVTLVYTPEKNPREDTK